MTLHFYIRYIFSKWTYSKNIYLSETDILRDIYAPFNYCKQKLTKEGTCVLFTSLRAWNSYSEQNIFNSVIKSADSCLIIQTGHCSLCECHIRILTFFWGLIFTGFIFITIRYCHYHNLHSVVSTTRRLRLERLLWFKCNRYTQCSDHSIIVPSRLEETS